MEITDAPSAMEINSRLEGVEKQANEKVQSLEKQIFALQEELKLAKVTPSTPVRDLPCFLPFKRADGRIITSTVIHDTDQWFKTGFCEFDSEKKRSRCAPR